MSESKRHRPEHLLVYDSLTAAAAALEIPKAVLQRAKAAGAPGFKAGRIYPLELLPWLASRRGDTTAEVAALKDKRTLECELLVAKTDALRFEQDRERGLYWLKSDFDAWCLRKAEQLKKIMHDTLEVQLPPKLEGLRAPEIAAAMRLVIVDLVTQFRDTP